MIKNIIFDFGGVLLNIDYYRAVEAFKRLGSPVISREHIQAAPTQLIEEYEKGGMSSPEFRMRFKAFIQLPLITDQQFDEAWNAIFLDLPKERLDFLDMLRKEGYRIFLLSNTNEIHLQSVFEKINRAHFESYFEKVYYSHLMNQRKPDCAIFETVLRENHLLPQETLFVDDSEGHINGARQAGLKVYHLTPNKTLQMIVSDRLKGEE